MRASTAYFARGGTVILAIVVGIGGGLIMGNMVAPQSPKQGVEQTKLERQKSPEPIRGVAGPSQPVPYLATTQARNEVVAAPTQTQPESNSLSTAAPSAQTQAATQPAPQERAAPHPAASPQPVTASAQPATPESRAAAAEDTQARERDVDTRRTVERRKPQRRQQWVESRRRRQQELRAVEESVREDTEGRPGREFAAEPARREFIAERVRIETPQIRLFGSD